VERREDPVLVTGFALALASHVSGRGETFVASVAAALGQSGESLWWIAAIDTAAADRQWWAPVLLDPLGTGPIAPRADWLVRLATSPANPRQAGAPFGTPVTGAAPLPSELVWRLAIAGSMRAIRSSSGGETPTDPAFAGGLAVLLNATIELDASGRLQAAQALRTQGLGDPKFTALAIALLERTAPIPQSWTDELASFAAVEAPRANGVPATPMALAIGALRAAPADREAWFDTLRIQAPDLATALDTLPPG
jgi:hypothetical protein